MARLPAPFDQIAPPAIRCPSCALPWTLVNAPPRVTSEPSRHGIIRGILLKQDPRINTPLELRRSRRECATLGGFHFVEPHDPKVDVSRALRALAVAASARGRARPSCRSRPPSGSPCPRPTRSPSTTTGGHSAAVGTVLHMVMTCRQCTVPSPSPQHEFCLSGTLIACVGVCPRRRAHVAAMAMVRYTVCKQTRSSSRHAP